MPQPTGISGQIAVPLAFPSGAVIGATNVRQGRDGIRLWASRDGGATWDIGNPIQMWDAQQSRMLGASIDSCPVGIKDEGVWEALDKFSFGTPDLNLLNDGSVLLTYYATIDDICHVRACRFSVEAF